MAGAVVANVRDVVAGRIPASMKNPEAWAGG
jgi:hypothetical protein